MSAPRLVGEYRLGVDNVRLFIGEKQGGGASFLYGPKAGGSAVMTVNCKGRPWSDCVSALLHEALESLIHRRGAGYVQTHTVCETADCYTFVLSHQLFGQCCDQAAEFLAECLPDLSEAWRKHNKKG